MIEQITAWIEEIRAEEITFEENAALHGDETTDELAKDALRRPERFTGEHEVARTWLKKSPTACTFMRRESGSDDGGTQR